MTSRSTADVFVSQPHLAEVVRVVCTQLYALGDSPEVNKFPPIHANEITTAVMHRFGDIPEISPTREQIKAMFELLVKLHDIGKVGSGYYLPRESRVVVYSKSVGRVAGGLPYNSSEHCEEDVGECDGKTIGRIISIDGARISDHPEWSFSKYYDWARKSVHQRRQDLLARLVSPCSPIPGSIQYYNPLAKYARFRGSRWQSQLPQVSPIVARYPSGRYAYSYYLVLDGGANWFELVHGQHKHWLVSVDQEFEQSHQVLMERGSAFMNFSLPIHVPDFAIRALVGASFDFSNSEGLWNFRVSYAHEAFVEEVFSNTSLVINE